MKKILKKERKMFWMNCCREIENAVKIMKEKKSPGLDEVSVEMIRGTGPWKCSH